MPTHVKYLFLSLASRHLLPKNTWRILRSQRLAFNALQTRGSLTVFASRCIMTLGVLRAILTLFISKKPLKCNWCEVALLHQMAFQRHAFDVHHVRSRQRCANPVQELQRQE